MKMKFKMTGSGETKVSIDVRVESLKYVLTRDEVRRKKTNLENAIHEVLRDFGYDVKEIRISK